MTNEKREKLAASRVRASNAANLAQQGLYRCGGRCKEVKLIEEGLVTFWGGTVLFGVCPDCFPATPVVMQERELDQGGRGIWVGPLNKADRGPEIAIVKDVPSNADQMFKAAVAERVKVFP